MSSWVENQRKETFLLYQRYLGLVLHFQDGSSYDYTLYNGGTRATLAAFLKKPKTEIAKFMQLKNKLSGITAEEFLFANARYDNLEINKLLLPDAMHKYRVWKLQYGEPEYFKESVTLQLQHMVNTLGPNTEIAAVATRILDMGNDRGLELLAWLLQENPIIITDLRREAEQNVLRKMLLTKVIKAQKFYSYLCLI